MKRVSPLLLFLLLLLLHKAFAAPSSHAQNPSELQLQHQKPHSGETVHFPDQRIELQHTGGKGNEDWEIWSKSGK